MLCKIIVLLSVLEMKGRRKAMGVPADIRKRASSSVDTDLPGDSANRKVADFRLLLVQVLC